MSLLYLLLRPRSPRTPFIYPMGRPRGNTTFSPTPERQIPPYVHYVFGLSPFFGGKPFGFIQYVCLSSSLVLLKPEVIFMHYVYAPDGWWWEQWRSRIEKSGTTRLEMVKQRDVDSIFGNPVEHFAHKADVIRLEVLRDYGGVYLDTDVMVIRGTQLSSFHVQVYWGQKSDIFSQRSCPAVSACSGDGNGIATQPGSFTTTFWSVQCRHPFQALQQLYWSVGALP